MPLETTRVALRVLATAVSSMSPAFEKPSAIVSVPCPIDSPSTRSTPDAVMSSGPEMLGMLCATRRPSLRTAVLTETNPTSRSVPPMTTAPAPPIDAPLPVSSTTPVGRMWSVSPIVSARPAGTTSVCTPLTAPSVIPSTVTSTSSVTAYVPPRSTTTESVGFGTRPRSQFVAVAHAPPDALVHLITVGPPATTLNVALVAGS